MLKTLTVASKLVLLAVAFPASAYAADAWTVVVDSTLDAPDADPNDGACATVFRRCTLRAAVQSEALVIIVPAGTYQLTIPGANEDDGATGDLDLHEVIIIGAGADRTIIDGGGLDRVFDLKGPDAGRVDLYGLTIRNGLADNGGGIRHGNNGTLWLTDVEVTGNSATTDGGGIYSCAPLGTHCRLYLENVTVAGNSAGRFGGGIAALLTYGTWRTFTISGNSAATGGGLYLGPVFVSFATTMSGATIASNSANEAGGIYNRLVNLSLANTIAAGNSGGDCGGTVGWTSNGHNLDSDNTCNLLHSGDLPGVDPDLGPLTNNGGQTRTHALLPGSPAIDAGNNAGCFPKDQRRQPRPVDGNLDGIPTCDIGAFEYQPPSPASQSE